MKTYTQEELDAICAKHLAWLRNEDGGERADLQGADLHGAYLQAASLQGAYLQRAYLQGAYLQRAYLQDAYLQGACLQRADLQDAYLQDAYLQDANLQGADLQGAYLQDANLQDANLQGADLRGAYLQDANLQDAYLQRASLQGAYLQGANLQGADLKDSYLQDANLQGADLKDAVNGELAQAMAAITPQGALVGWKKCHNELGGECIVKLLIPEDAKRSNATSRKCRAEFAVVLDIEGAELAMSEYNFDFIYRKGETVRPDAWDENRWNECSNGIHFFITREEAEAWTL